MTEKLVPHPVLLGTACVAWLVTMLCLAGGVTADYGAAGGPHLPLNLSLTIGAIAAVATAAWIALVRPPLRLTDRDWGSLQTWLELFDEELDESGNRMN